jgi:thiosulfate/3-mercaptopyruvate sulfurtransferase
MNNLVRIIFFFAVFGVGTAAILPNHHALANGQSGRSAASSAETGAQAADPLVPGSAQVINPDDLLAILQSEHGPKPLILNVGPHLIYMQAHIPGAEFIGSPSDSQGMESLRQRLKPLPRNTFVVLYCGCCPWGHCPNVRPAYRELQKAGFTNVKVLYIADNFGADWVDKGYPTIKGQ